MSFKDKCVHCEHYKEKVGTCCFCQKTNLPEVDKKTREEHLAEIGEDEIDI